MKNDTYALNAENSLTVFEFISNGPKGLIPKLVQFQQTDQPDLYNLAFGDKNAETGKIDDLAISNNGDSEKVLATVISSLYAFFSKYPDAFVYATGGSSIRMRLYRMVITRFYEEIFHEFELYGQIGEKFYEFEFGKDYISFLVRRKVIKLHYDENSTRT